MREAALELFIPFSQWSSNMCVPFKVPWDILITAKETSISLPPLLPSPFASSLRARMVISRQQHYRRSRVLPQGVVADHCPDSASLDGSPAGAEADGCACAAVTAGWPRLVLRFLPLPPLLC
jgi:hypothetical protein